MTGVFEKVPSDCTEHFMEYWLKKTEIRPDWDRTQILPHVRDTCKKCRYPDFLGWDTKQHSIPKQKETADHLIALLSGHPAPRNASTPTFSSSRPTARFHGRNQNSECEEGRTCLALSHAIPGWNIIPILPNPTTLAKQVDSATILHEGISNVAAREIHCAFHLPML